MLHDLSLLRERKREVCIRAEGGNGGGAFERPCATIFNLLRFITTVFLTANTHCMTDGLTVRAVEPSVSACDVRTKP